jgi:hypothetical protein
MSGKISSKIYNLITQKYSWANIVFDLIKYAFIAKKVKTYMHFINKSAADMLLDNYESEVSSFFIPLPNDIVIDVEANIGYFIIHTSRKVGKKGLVIALEPMDKTYNCLMKKLRLNHSNKVKPFKLALWSNKIILELYRIRDNYRYSKFYDLILIKNDFNKN